MGNNDGTQKTENTLCESLPSRPDGPSWQGERQRLPPADGRRTHDGEGGERERDEDE